MATRDTDSYIFRRGVTPNTLSVISSKNRIIATNAAGISSQIGAVATFDPSETRTIEPVRGIGFGDYIAELVPGITDPMTLAVTRTALYISMIYQVFGYKGGIDGFVRSLRHHRWPFDIRQEVIFSQLANQYTPGIVTIDSGSGTGPKGVPDADDTNMTAVVTLYEACWISDYSVSFAADAALVQETVTVHVTDILGVGTDGPISDEAQIDSIDSGAISARLSPAGAVTGA